MFVNFPKRFIKLPRKSISSDPYTILGVQRSDNLAKVKKEYYKLAKKYHPDLNPDDKRAQELFLKV